MTARAPLRVWPGVVLAIVLVLARYVVPLLGPDVEVYSMPLPIIGILGGVVCAIAIVLWWLFFSRAPWSERLGAIVVMTAALFATSRVVHESIAGGMMGALLYIYAIPLLGVALVAGALATRHLPDGTRRAALFAAIVLACVPWTLLRTAGSLGAGSEFHWRWTPTPEQRLLARAGEAPVEPARAEPKAPPPSPPAAESGREPATTKAGETPPQPGSSAAVAAAPPGPGTEPAPAAADDAPEWPGFRGPGRDGVVRGVRITTDWSQSPPVEIWRRPIGPGWSSFSVHGDRLYTQEQRGDDEIVASYRVSTGEPIWRHRDPVRFWESNGGAGPRGTPTLHDGRVYTVGATGILNALDAATGAVLWSRNAATDADVELPVWGFASSPLATGGLVVVAVSGRLAAYDAGTGATRWLGPAGGAGYSSPHLVTIGGVTQVLLLRGSRTISVAPADGTLLWEHTWAPGVGIVQPGVAPGGDLLLTIGDSMGGIGIRRVAVAKAAGGWSAAERWTSRGLKPYFNDFVVHEGHAYGFDGSILACIDLEDGARKWKGGRYGNGQLVLLPEQDQLLVLSEEGELALVHAAPDRFTEVARFQAIEGKTWNHPVVVGNVLLVRNGQEMAAFRLPSAGR
jgi:outer membrane protein assembly factor BamB